MPADETYDTPHPTTVKSGHKEHCWNNRSPRGAGYWAQHGWSNRNSEHRHLYSAGRGFAAVPCPIEPQWVWVEDRMSQPCGQRKGMAPPGCEGCKELGEAQ